MFIVSNAFSFNMFAEVPELLVNRELTVEEAKELVSKEEFISSVGHADTAAILSNMLDADIPFNRANDKLGSGDKILVAQYSGPRLPEGTTTLPEGSKIKFILVQIKKKEDVGCYHCGPDCVQW